MFPLLPVGIPMPFLVISLSFVVAGLQLSGLLMCFSRSFVVVLLFVVAGFGLRGSSFACPGDITAPGRLANEQVLPGDEGYEGDEGHEEGHEGHEGAC